MQGLGGKPAARPEKQKKLGPALRGYRRPLLLIMERAFIPSGSLAKHVSIVTTSDPSRRTGIKARSLSRPRCISWWLADSYHCTSERRFPATVYPGRSFFAPGPAVPENRDSRPASTQSRQHRIHPRRPRNPRLRIRGRPKCPRWSRPRHSPRQTAAAAPDNFRPEKPGRISPRTACGAAEGASLGSSETPSATSPSRRSFPAPRPASRLVLPALG